MNPVESPVARELFDQWKRARGNRTEQASRPFSRNWEDLLHDAGLESAIERNSAESDVKSLSQNGWIELKHERFKTYFIESVRIPLEAETRWCTAFGFVQPTGEEARQIREFPWVSELSFVRDAKIFSSFLELRLLNDFFARGGQNSVLVPIKERSLEIFGNEKRLDQLLGGPALFGEGRLTLEMLRCFTVSEPLPWSPGADASKPVIVIENAATWHSYRQWNKERHLFSAVVYGCGNRFVDSVPELREVFSALGGERPVFYFGDLDARGLSIPQQASARAQGVGLPVMQSHVWSYQQLLKLGHGRAQAYDGDLPEPALCEWLGELAEPARALLAIRQRLPQEYVGWEFLRSCAV